MKKILKVVTLTSFLAVSLFLLSNVDSVNDTINLSHDAHPSILSFEVAHDAHPSILSTELFY